MTTFTKTQQLYQFLFPKAVPQTEILMNEAILEFYQAAGFAVLTIEDIYQTIAFYDYERIQTLADLRKRLYRQVVGYGLLADAKLKTTAEVTQEAEILAYYHQQGVEAESFAQLITYFPCSRQFSELPAPTVEIETEREHKLF